MQFAYIFTCTYIQYVFVCLFVCLFMCVFVQVCVSVRYIKEV